jgi:hypothetical protein
MRKLPDLIGCVLAAAGYKIVRDRLHRCNGIDVKF